jgi:hypothetical protein
MSTDLTKLIEDVTSLHWWITVIFLTLVLNIVSAYAKPWLDKWYGGYSAKKKAMTAAQEAEFAEAVRKLCTDPLLVVLVGLEEIRYAMMFAVQLLFMVAIGGLMELAEGLQLQGWINTSVHVLLIGVFMFVGWFSLDTISRAQRSARFVGAAKRKLLTDRGLIDQKRPS